MPDHPDPVSAPSRGDAIQAAYDVLTAVERDLNRARDRLMAIPFPSSEGLPEAGEVSRDALINDLGGAIHRVALARITAQNGLYRLGRWSPEPR
jgi:hypothetical protein